MEGTKKKIPAILLACLMAAALALVMNVLDTQPAYASNFSSDAKLYIDGQDVNPNESASSEKDGWTYSNGTLTLSNADFTTYVPEGTVALIQVEGMDLTIVLNGTNSVNGVSLELPFGISIEGGTLTIEGSGDLQTIGYNSGIFSESGDLVIKGSGKVEAHGGYCGIMANDIDIDGTEVFADLPPELKDPEMFDSGILSYGHINIKGAKVTAPDGIVAEGNISVTDGTNLTCGSKNAYTSLIAGPLDVLWDGDKPDAGSDITIKDSSVYVEGINGLCTTGSLIIKDTTGTTEVKAISTDEEMILDEDNGEPQSVVSVVNPAIRAVKTIELGDNVDIVSPTGGVIGSFYMPWQETDFVTVLESNREKVAMDVLIKATSKPQPKPTPKPDNKTSNVMVTKMTAVGSNSLKFTWTKMKNVDGYDIFFANCSMKSKHVCKPKLVKTIKGNKKNFWIKTNLKKKTAYKAYIKAWVMKDGKKQYVKKSPSAHAYTGGTKKVTNVKSVKVKKRNVILTPGKTFKIKAKLKKVKKGKKLITSKHAKKLRYISSDTKIATVSKGGRIKAKAKGTCKIFVIAINGATKVVNVTVR